jgi:L-threonylcarbamoyladenylate synthase
MGLRTRLLTIDPLHPSRRKINQAATVIKNGGLVAFPTETVYGLGANAFDEKAVKEIFIAKKRPADNPLIVHIYSLDQLEQITGKIPTKIRSIARDLWPGPLTFLLSRSDNVPEIVCGGTKRVAVRMPAHPVALKLIEKSGVPIAAPSANLSTKPSPTSALHVMSDLDGRIDLVLDGGDTFFGVESTIVDMTSEPYKLLRPGAYGPEDLRRKLGTLVIPKSIRNAGESADAIVPGMKYRHYAPAKPLYVIEKKNLIRNQALLNDPSVGILCSKELSKEGSIDNPNLIILGSEKNLFEVAKNLFASFRLLDGLNVKFGIVQTFKERGIGLAIMNRIIKATSHKSATVRNGHLVSNDAILV